MKDIKVAINVKEELFIIEQAEQQDVQEPTLLTSLDCFE